MEEIDVLCINCENLITLELISSHSLECVTPVTFIIPENSDDQVNLINQRLAKLCISLQSSMNKKKQICTKTFLALESLLRKAQKAKSLNISQSTDTSQFVALIHEIEMNSDEKLSLAVQVYTERLKVLIEEKALVIPQREKEYETNRQFFYHNQESHLTVTKRELSDFVPSEFFKAKKCYLNDVDSVIESQSRRSLSLASSVQFEITEPKKLLNLEELAEEDKCDSEDEDLDYFVSQYLMIQLSYPSFHPVQKANVRELYKESKMKKIDFEGWANFIEDKFREIS